VAWHLLDRSDDIFFRGLIVDRAREKVRVKRVEQLAKPAETNLDFCFRACRIMGIWLNHDAPQLLRLYAVLTKREKSSAGIYIPSYATLTWSRASTPWPFGGGKPQKQKV
jgi:hypothetical protein